MTEQITGYYDSLKKLIDEMVYVDKEGARKPFEEGFLDTICLIEEAAGNSGKLIFIGNGASAAMSSHLATDFWKNGGIKAIAFNDPAGLTCVSNDYSYEEVFAKPIEMFMEEQDILIAISSSGKSSNIIQAVKAARQKQGKVITLSGFQADNPLKKMGDCNFYVPENQYGPVEVLHHSICHGLIDVIMTRRNHG